MREGWEREGDRGGRGSWETGHETNTGARSPKHETQVRGHEIQTRVHGRVYTYTYQQHHGTCTSHPPHRKQPTSRRKQTIHTHTYQSMVCMHACMYFKCCTHIAKRRDLLFPFSSKPITYILSGCQDHGPVNMRPWTRNTGDRSRDYETMVLLFHGCGSVAHAC